MGGMKGVKVNSFNVGLYLGFFLFLVIILMPTPTGMTESAQIVAGIAVLMACWWISEAIPFAITALIPVCFFPVFGVMEVKELTPAYANQIIFLFLSGFIFALCIERWNLHKRIALYTIQLFGYSPHKILLGFMSATAFLSMWVSNTATVLMMIPVAVAVATRLDPGSENDNQSTFTLLLMLGIAYSASIGGVATLIGTPPNAILAGMLEQQSGISIRFFDWMLFAFPLALIFLIITWYYLMFSMREVKSNDALISEKILGEEITKLNPLSQEEKQVIFVFSIVCFFWIVRGFIDIELFQRIKDSTIGMIGVIVLFILPAKNGTQRLMDWKTTRKVPWEILILFGGGFALASGFEQTGLTHWLTTQFEFLQGIPIVVVVFTIVLIVIFLTEITSNTATATLLIPLMIALSPTLDLPAMWLATAVAIATSYAFMLPVATPPNAIVYSTGRVSVKKMAKAGFLLNIVGSILITTAIFILMPLIWP